MNQNNSNKSTAKAKAFFERAEMAARKQNFDYAIDMFLEGLRCSPNDLQHGHLPFREMAMIRKGKGGAKPTIVERAKFMVGKSPLERMLNAEYLFAKDPENLSYAEALLKSAVSAEFKNTAQWIADLIFHMNNNAKKPSAKIYILLKDSYASIGMFDRAVAACEKAVQLRPQDTVLSDEIHKLSAELTMAKGKYNQAGDFRESIKDRQAQERLQSQDSVVKTEHYRCSELELARKVYTQSPEEPKNILRLVQALVNLEEDKYDEEAIELLETAYKSTSDFSFKQQAGQIKIKQLKRKIRKIKTALEANPNAEQLEAEVSQLSSQLNNVELEHYELCVKNYPTDSQVKYEYAVRLVRNKQYDDALPLFQEAKKDPRYKISAMNKIGMSFFLKGWNSDAIDIFKQAIACYEIQDDHVGKELHYNLGRAYEQKGDIEKALEIYRKIAQIDFGYKDVHQRIDNLRGSQNKS